MMRRKKEEGLIITMSNRRKERRPLQRGRISTETIQAVQALKRAKNDPHLLHRIFDSKIRRLIKFDLIALLRELQRQNEPFLSLQVFEEIRKEYWYKPQVSVYADMVAVVASNGLFEKVHLLFSYLRAEILNADADADVEAEGFNVLLTTLMEFGIYEVVMECFQLMKEAGCEPDKSTFRILINGFESKGEMDLSAIVRQEAEKYFGESLEFLLEKEEEAVLTSHTECL
ncbi:hypothetical protein MRB53_012990 [Persea americana]|uniref:Uncharacterized protein n=1 Tax=Persea americana TaxID=3435 RepID=A0ACC2LZA7_PERAE|nr:hypothetical protein MRB53_012990 [Persea americana]